MLRSDKPIVSYIAGQCYIPGVGGRAVVYPLDHPDTYNVSNTRYVPVASPDRFVVQ